MKSPIIPSYFKHKTIMKCKYIVSLIFLAILGCSNIQNKTSQVFDNANDALKSDAGPFWIENEPDNKNNSEEYNKKINNFVDDKDSENLY